MRWHRIVLLLVSALCGYSALAAQPAFDFTFDGPPVVDGLRGRALDVHVWARMETRGLDDPDGAGGWSMSIGLEGCTVSDLSVDGLVSDLSGSELRDGGFVFFESIAGGGGAVLAVVLPEGQRLLPSQSPHDVLRLTVNGRVPFDASCADCRLSYVDGLRGSGQPVRNRVSLGQDDVVLSLGETTVRFRENLCEGSREVAETRSPPPCTAPDVTLLPCQRSACFTFRPTPGKPILLDLDDLAPGNSNALYIRWGAPATPADNDGAAQIPGRSDQRLLIPRARDETCHVLVETTQFSRAVPSPRADLCLRVVLADLAVETFFPRRGAPGRLVSAVVLGGGYDPAETSVVLEHADDPSQVIPAQSLEFISSGRVECRFDLAAAPLGRYDLVGRGAAGLESRLPNAFEVVTPEEFEGLNVEILGQDLYRSLRNSRATFRYRSLTDSERTAPLFKLAGPAGSRLRLARDEEFSGADGDELLVLGVNPIGLAGRLPAGGEDEVSVVFQAEAPGMAFDADFRVELLAPSATGFIDWPRLQPPPGVDDWDSLWPGLSAELGDRWQDFHERLAALSTRLTRRGVQGASVRDVFRYAARRALRRPSAAVLGTVIERSTQAPLHCDAVAQAAGDCEPVTVMAIETGEEGERVASFAVTDAEGTFALDWLEGGGTYRLLVLGYSVVATLPAYPIAAGGVEVVLPEDEDLFPLELQVERGAAGPQPLPACANCDERNLPLAPVFPPASAFTPIDSWRTRVASSWDPNEKHPLPNQEPPDFRPVRDVREPIVFTVYFENLESAEIPARVVAVTDDLDPRLDCSTVEILGAGIGRRAALVRAMGEDRFSGYNLQFEEDGFTAETRIDAGHTWRRPSGDPWPIDVRVRADVDCETRRIEWTFETLSKGSELPPADELAGFLPPNDPEPLGEGYVSFSVMADVATPDGDPVPNLATITFDGGRRVVTNRSTVVVTTGEDPEAPTTPSPADNASCEGPAVPATTALSWVAGEHAFFHDVYLWKQGDPQTRVAADFRGTVFQPRRRLEHDTCYLWRLVARNLLGEKAAGPTWTFRTVPPPPAEPPRPRSPVNLRISVVGCADRRPTLRWDPAAGAAGERYTVFLDADSGGIAEPTTVEARVGAATELTLGRDLVPGPYFWRVVATNEFFTHIEDGAASMVARFEVCDVPPEPRFVRGDADVNGRVEITDAIRTLNFLFLGTGELPCRDAADADDNGRLEITDAIRLLNYLFLGTGVIPPPAPSRPSYLPSDCGADPTADALLPCEMSPPPCG
jgi:hypothetical protein